MRNTSNNPNSENQTPNTDRGITIKAARKMLGMVARNYSDDDLSEILSILYGIAEEGYEAYLEDNGGAKDLLE